MKRLAWLVSLMLQLTSALQFKGKYIPPLEKYLKCHNFKNTKTTLSTLNLKLFYGTFSAYCSSLEHVIHNCKFDIPDSGCGNNKDLRTAPGTITSHPGFGETLAPTQFCEWIISPPRDKYVRYTISSHFVSSYPSLDRVA